MNCEESNRRITHSNINHEFTLLGKKKSIFLRFFSCIFFYVFSCTFFGCILFLQAHKTLKGSSQIISSCISGTFSMFWNFHFPKVSSPGSHPFFVLTKRHNPLLEGQENIFEHFQYESTFGQHLVNTCDFVVGEDLEQSWSSFLHWHRLPPLHVSFGQELGRLIALIKPVMGLNNVINPKSSKNFSGDILMACLQ